MARTPLLRQLSAAFRTAGLSLGRKQPEGITRRDFLRRSSAVGVGVALGGCLALGEARSSAFSPRIAVVGAGLAGLTCGYRLKQAGFTPALYEASDRAGGRCWTDRHTFDAGQIVEQGGELIDQGHKAIRHLAAELGLELVNLLQAEAKGTEPCYYFGGTPYSYREATDDLKAIWQKLHKDLTAAGYPTLYNRSTPRGLELDQLSITQWLAEAGASPRLTQLLDVAYTIEYGGEASEQSALNLLYLLGYIGPGQLRMFGPSNEKYRVRGGNDQIATRLQAALADCITTGARLEAIRQLSNSTYRLTFRSGSSSYDVEADRVVLTVPFSVLREQVDFTGANFRPLKETAIRELGYGSNCKLQLQFTDRQWEALGCNGETYSETGYQCTWDVSRGQAGAPGILVNYTGGARGEAVNGDQVTGEAERFLSEVEPVLPGLSAKWNGLVTANPWGAYQHTRGSYSYWKVGQYTRFAGMEGEREGHCHFAGEHTSIDFQGYLNGAVESGERAAAEIIGDLRSRRERGTVR